MQQSASPLTIVIPAYNEERRLPRTLREIDRWVARHEPEAEVIVVENGSTDRTVQIVRDFQAEHPYVRLIEGVPRGKGRAVREGMLSAGGALCFLCDADLSMPIDELDTFLGAMRTGADAAIGSRELPDSRRVDEPPLRHFMGRVFNLLVKAIVVRGFEDTQCGFKMFRRAAARDIFRRSRLSGWGFDAEILFLAHKLGYRVVEVPIEWHSDRDSRVRPVHDALAMIRELFAIRRNDMRGAYGD